MGMELGSDDARGELLEDHVYISAEELEREVTGYKLSNFATQRGRFRMSPPRFGLLLLPSDGRWLELFERTWGVRFDRSGDPLRPFIRDPATLRTVVIPHFDRYRLGLERVRARYYEWRYEVTGDLEDTIRMSG